MLPHKQHGLGVYPTLLITALMVSGLSCRVYGDEYFNLDALSHFDGANVADISSLEQFSRSGVQLPGRYHVNIIINDKVIGIKEIDFILDAEQKQLEPVLTKQMLNEWGVKTDVIPALKDLANADEIIGLNHYIEYATTQFLFSQQTIKITIPQIALNAAIRGRIDPDLWDQGMSAFMVNYTFNGDKTQYKNNATQNNQFLSLRNGLNFGPWRLRNYATYDHSRNQSHWQSVNTYLERDIQSLNAQLTLGEVSTSGELFSSVQFKGVKLASDESMLPYSLRGFAPVVRGFAQSNAKVTVRQNGAIIYQTYVAPGPFAFTDLYPTAYSGNLDVTVAETDGSEQSFVVPFASLAIMQRQGGIKYSVNVGEYRNNGNNSSTPRFLESTLIYGLPWNTTAYGGTLLSKDYQAYALGFGFDLGDLGAISLDATHASSKFDFDSEKKSGQAYRIQYTKTLVDTGSTITLAGYRYSSSEFYDFADANQRNNLSSKLNKYSRYQMNLSQSFAQYGSVYLSVYQQDYWQSSAKERNISAGYNVVVNNIAYGLSYGYTDMPTGNGAAHQVTFRINIPLSNIPLGNKLPGNNYLTSSVSSLGHGNNTVQTGLSGSALENNNLTYSIQQSYDQQDHRASGNASLAYQGGSGYINMGYAYSKDTQRMNYGLQGGLVIHPYGVTLSQPLGDTIAIIAAPGASGVQVQNSQGLETNRWGYAVKPYLSPYMDNRITLNVGQLSDNVDLVNNNVMVVPTKGAVVLAKIDTKVGYRVLMTLHHDGKPLPFGAVATLHDQDSTGIVGDSGEVYLSGMPAQGRLTVKWGQRSDQQCMVAYTLPGDNKQPTIQRIALDCI